jgi:hypothetical protein
LCSELVRVGIFFVLFYWTWWYFIARNCLATLAWSTTSKFTDYKGLFSSGRQWGDWKEGYQENGKDKDQDLWVCEYLTSHDYAKLPIQKDNILLVLSVYSLDSLLWNWKISSICIFVLHWRIEINMLFRFFFSNK